AQYPLCRRGRINTYALFAVGMRLILRAKGYMGCIVPSGIATDDTTKYFFRNVAETQTLVSLYDFENADGIFPTVHRSYKFCLLTTCGIGKTQRVADFAFFARQTTDLQAEKRHFSLSATDIALLN